MSEIRDSEVRAIRKRLFCDCGGEMKPTGECLMTSPMKYPHKCVDCDHRETMWKLFPYVEYEDVEWWNEEK